MVLGDEHLAGASKGDIKTATADRALGVVSRKMRDARNNMNVLVAFTSLEKCRDLAKKFPLFDVLVTAGGAGDPTKEPEIIPTSASSSTSMIQVGVKGMYVGLVGYFVGTDGKPLSLIHI